MGKRNNGITAYDNTRAIYWNGIVGLLYPSDYAYTYSKGVDNMCYNDPTQCYEISLHDTDYDGENGYPDSGWIYNSNNREGEIESEIIWSLSSLSNNANEVFGLDSVIDDFSVYYPIATRPVVYLKSSIQITGGDGSELNPYTLSS